MIVALVVTAIGGSLIKPSVVGTVARTTTPESNSLGYSIYYTLVNIGGAVGPLLAVPVRENIGIAYVLMMSSATTFLLMMATLIVLPRAARGRRTCRRSSRWARVLADMVRVFGDVRFMTFLVIFSGFWVMFWQIFYSLPFYVRDVLHYPRFEVIETVDAWTIIFVTVPAAALARKLRPIRAMTLGFALATLSWFVMGSIPTLAGTVGAIMLFAVGESIQAPRYYEYVANLAPRDQVGNVHGLRVPPRRHWHLHRRARSPAPS